MHGFYPSHSGIVNNRHPTLDAGSTNDIAWIPDSHASGMTIKTNPAYDSPPIIKI